VDIWEVYICERERERERERIMTYHANVLNIGEFNGKSRDKYSDH